MINIYTINHILQTGKKQYCFRSTLDQTLDTDHLIKAMVKYNSTVTEADIRATLSILSDTVKQYMNLGYKVELPFGYAFLKATGTVEKINDGFVPGTQNHRLSATFRFKDDAALEIENSTAYRHAASGYVILPEIVSIEEILSDGSEAQISTLGTQSMFRLHGQYLSFDPKDPKQGVFFIASDNSETAVKRYSRIGTSITDGFMPDNLAPGSYNIKIVTKPGIDRLENFTFSKKIEVGNGTQTDPVTE